jgi:hypothetical protein
MTIGTMSGFAASAGPAAYVEKASRWPETGFLVHADKVIE